MKRTLLILAALAGVCLQAFGQVQIFYHISTLAGGAAVIGDGGSALSAPLLYPAGIAVDRDGSLYIADRDNHRVRKVSASGVITTVAGTGALGFAGDGGDATAAQLYSPTGVAVDFAGNLYIADRDNHRIRKVIPTGAISTVVGSGAGGFGGDGGPVASAQLLFPTQVAVDASGNLYIADTANQRIRKATPTGVITTLAGSGETGFKGDGGAASAAELNNPGGVAVDASGNVYVADTGNHRVRRITPGGVITTVAGNGNAGFSSDGIPATSSRLSRPMGVAVDASGVVYIADTDNNRIRRVATGAVISTVAGTGTRGFGGEGSAALSADFNSPGALAIDANGTLYISDVGNSRIRKMASGVVSTVAGTAAAPGDGGPGEAAQLFSPWGVAADASGNVYVSDRLNHRVRKVNSAGVITTFAGTGSPGFSGDGGPATGAQLAFPHGLAVDPAGNLYIADTQNQRIRKVTPAGVISTHAGAGTPGFSGDLGPATSAELVNPMGLATDAAGNLYVADTDNHRIRRITPGGTISTVAGSDRIGFSGDGAAATAASLRSPIGVAVDGAGNLYIADTGNNRIRKVRSGLITTLAGTGANSFSGEGGPASSASLDFALGVAADRDGNVFIADANNGRVRRVSPAGTITTIAGVGAFGFSGDGGPATLAQVNVPIGLAVDAAGNLYVADNGNHRIRKLAPNLPTGLLIVGGNGQRGQLGARLESPLVVRVVSNIGVGVPGVTINFAVTTGSATLEPRAAETSSEGLAATEATLGDAPGTVIITASASGIASVAFTVTAGAEPAAGAPPRIGVVVGAGLSTPSVRQIAPNGLISIFGENFAPADTQRLVSEEDLAGGRLPTNLDGVCVQVGPELAPIIAVLPGQINAQVPSIAGSGPAPVQVVLNCGRAGEIRSNAETVSLQPAAPEFFFFVQNAGGRNPIAAVNATTGAPIADSGLFPGLGQPIRPGQIATLFATGLGATNPPFQAGDLPDRPAAVVSAATLTIGGIAAEVLYAGVAPGFAGLYQLNVRAPESAADGDLPVSLRVGSAATPAGAFLTVRR